MALYTQVQRNGVKTAIHRIRAERALGKPLPPGAVVHHSDGTRDDDGPLVICENQAYHLLLHKRMRVKAAGGDPNADKICTTCRRALPLTDFTTTTSSGDGHAFNCRPCSATYQALRRAKIAAEA